MTTRERFPPSRDLSHRTASRRTASHRIASHRTASHRTTPHHTTPHYTTPHHTTPHHTTPHHTTPHLTASHRISPHARTHARRRRRHPNGPHRAGLRGDHLRLGRLPADLRPTLRQRDGPLRRCPAEHHPAGAGPEPSPRRDPPPPDSLGGSGPDLR